MEIFELTASNGNTCRLVPSEAVQADTVAKAPPGVHRHPIEERILGTAGPVDHHITMRHACPIFELAVATAVP
jgi:hypothetical protein